MSDLIPCTATQLSPTVLLPSPPFEYQLSVDPIVALDPLEPDQVDDPSLTLSHREITRLVYVAAETGARFARERSPHDPAAWMTAPRQLFEGQNALTACLDRSMFMRALVLHGVTALYDMAPAAMDELLAGDDEDTETLVDAAQDDLGVPPGITSLRPRQNRLFTATFVDESSVSIVHVFFAAVASREDEVRDQLRARLGGKAAYLADVSEGFDPSEPVSLSLLSEAMACLLGQIARDPTSALGVGFTVLLEHRFCG